MVIVDAVTRTFHNQAIVALRDISFSVQEGETVGIIGKNGAGKTTLLKMIAGILKPSSGRIWTFGKEPCAALARNRREMGCLFTMHSQLFAAHTLKEAYEYHRLLYHVTQEEYEEMFESFGKSLGIHHYYMRSIGSLSVGQKRCGEFFAAVMHKPRLLLLDEPTIGMDAKSRRIFNDAICFLNQRHGVTILTSSHDLQSLERVSKRVLLLQDKTISFDGKWEWLKKRADTWQRVTFVTETMVDLEDIPVRLIGYENGRMELIFQGKDLTEEELRRFLSERAQIRDFCVCEPELEKIVSEILRGGA